MRYNNLAVVELSELRHSTTNIFFPNVINICLILYYKCQLSVVRSEQLMTFIYITESQKSKSDGHMRGNFFIGAINVEKIYFSVSFSLVIR